MPEVQRNQAPLKRRVPKNRDLELAEAREPAVPTPLGDAAAMNFHGPTATVLVQAWDVATAIGELQSRTNEWNPIVKTSALIFRCQGQAHAQGKRERTPDHHLSEHLQRPSTAIRCFESVEDLRKTGFPRFRLAEPQSELIAPVTNLDLEYLPPGFQRSLRIQREMFEPVELCDDPCRITQRQQILAFGDELQPFHRAVERHRALIHATLDFVRTPTQLTKLLVGDTFTRHDKLL